MKRENGKYYLVLLFNVDIQPKKPVEGKIGIDAGVKDFITLSTGEKINYPNRMKVLEERVKREQRKLSHRRKGSNNYLDGAEHDTKSEEEARRERQAHA